MRAINHLFIHAKRYGMNHRSLYVAGTMYFFWSIFDSIISFIAPIVIVEKGFSATAMGIILGSASIAGAIFDFILAKFLQNTHFRRIYLIMFAASFAFLFVLWQANTIFLFLAAMALWGVSYDLIGFGSFDFVGRQTATDEHVSSFGVLDVFKALGYLLGPILAGLVIVEMIDFKVFILALIFLIFAFAVYFALVHITKKEKRDYLKSIVYQHANTALEIKRWQKVGSAVLPLLVFIVLHNIYDAFFWTAGPLYSESFAANTPFAGFFMAAYSFPPLIIGWFVGNIVGAIGEKKAAFVTFLVGSILLALLPFINSFVLVLIVVLVSSTLVTISSISVRGLLVDRLTQKPKEEMEIEALGDFSINIGYVIGPMIAGLMIDIFGDAKTFSYMGLGGATIALLLLIGIKNRRVV